jgi:hypothetical protein
MREAQPFNLSLWDRSKEDEDNPIIEADLCKSCAKKMKGLLEGELEKPEPRQEKQKGGW